MSSRGMLPKCTLFLSVNNWLIQADTATTSSAGMSDCNECLDVGTLRYNDIINFRNGIVDLYNGWVNRYNDIVYCYNEILHRYNGKVERYTKILDCYSEILDRYRGTVNRYNTSSCRKCTFQKCDVGFTLSNTGPLPKQTGQENRLLFSREPHLNANHRTSL